MIPAAPGYVGTFDAPLQSLMTRLAGLSPEAALGYTLVVHAALVVPVVVVGLFLVWQEGLSLRAVTRGSLADGTTGPARERPAPRGIE